MVYFPWNIGEIFWEVMNLDHATLIDNAVRWALGDSAARRGRAARASSTSRRAKGRGKLSVHLVNLTNPMMMKGPIREAIPLAAQMVSVALPTGTTGRHGAAAGLRAATADVGIGGRTGRGRSCRRS